MTTPTDDTGNKQAGQFASGQSGNPSGRPKGSRNKTTLAVQALLEGEAEAISRKAIELAKEGDMAAIKLILERILPPRKDTPVLLDLPNISGIEDVNTAMETLLQAVSMGEITPTHGRQILGLIETRHTILQSTLQARKIDAIHNLLNHRAKP